MLNLCENCKSNCCLNFRITQEILDPEGLKLYLEKFPFIHKTSEALILVHGHERVVNVYNCDRFDLTKKVCKNYSSQERPNFCINTGIIRKPNSSCLLYRHENIPFSK